MDELSNHTEMCGMQSLIHAWYQIDGVVQDCSISSALAMEILQSYTKQWK